MKDLQGSDSDSQPLANQYVSDHDQSIEGEPTQLVDAVMDTTDDTEVNCHESKFISPSMLSYRLVRIKYIQIFYYTTTVLHRQGLGQNPFQTMQVYTN